MLFKDILVPTNMYIAVAIFHKYGSNIWNTYKYTIIRRDGNTVQYDTECLQCGLLLWQVGVYVLCHALFDVLRLQCHSNVSLAHLLGYWLAV